MNNHVFFQHPDLVRILRIHENVMAIMMNTLARRSQAENESANNEAESKVRGCTGHWGQVTRRMKAHRAAHVARSLSRSQGHRGGYRGSHGQVTGRETDVTWAEHRHVIQALVK